MHKMRCIFCEVTLDGGDKCPGCGEDVKLVKRIIATSNLLYNEGLKRAAVRDLSGAVEALKASLKLYKLNTDARNLLGLVYFEMGEHVDAITAWVISKSLQPLSNRADDFLNKIQANKNSFENINQTTKKYNLALSYCRQDGEDLAVIQLKKVVLMNPKMIRAHHLLALLHMKEGRYDLARKTLREAEKIDNNNTTTLRYLKECNNHLPKDDGRRFRKGKKEDNVYYRSGNETIIQPRPKKDFSSAASVIINLALGIGLGVLITWFLVVPGIRQAEKSAANASLSEVNDAISEKEQMILSLQNEIGELEGQVEASKKISDDAGIVLTTYEQLLGAYIAYVNGDIEGAGNALANVNTDYLDATGKNAYDTVNNRVLGDVLGEAYDVGYSAYQSGRLSEAIEYLLKVVNADETYREGDALYYLMMAYRKDKDDGNGALYAQKLIAAFPDTEMSREATRYLESLGIKPGETEAAVTE